MEENTFQYMNYDQYHTENNYEAANIFERWLMPGLAELGEMNRENYLMDKTNAFNEYMFDKANIYNSPAAQMERMKEAGVNPMLAAAGIAGNGAGAATPIPSQGANVGMNTNVESPFDAIAKVGNTIDTLTGATDRIGKLIGFGKENKLNFEIAKETAKKLKSETGLNWHNYKRLQSTFEEFCREMGANADKAEQEFLNLQKLWDKYNEETELLKKQTELTEEQSETQKELTQSERYKNWENEFKKQFREMFGVQLNDSDASMLAQLLLNGHGQELINAISGMIKSLGEGVKNELPNIPSKEQVWNTTKDAHKRFQDHIDKKVQRNKYKKRLNAVKRHWKQLPEHMKKKWGSEENYIEYMRSRGVFNGKYSGRW